MAEEHINDNNIPTEGFERARHFYTVDQGMVLVKKNAFTGRIRAKGTYTRESVRDYPTQNLYLHNLPDSKLAQLRTRLAGDPRHAADLAKVENEINFRNAAGSIPETPDLAAATIRVRGLNRAEIIRRRISARLGIKFRWPWQSVMSISLGELQLDTAAVAINTSENLQIKFDTDYRYRIIDPERYATEYNRLAEVNPKQDPGAVINDKVGHEMDQVVADYMRNIPYEALLTLKGQNLVNVLRYEIASRSYIQDCGIEINQVLLKDYVLPESLVKAAEAKKAATERAKSLEIESKAQADARRRLLAAEAIKPQQVVNQIVETLSEKFPDLPPEQLAAMASEIAKTTLAGQSILVQNAGNGMGAMFGTMAAAGSAMRGSAPASDSTDIPGDTSDFDEIIEDYVDEDGFLNNRKLRAVVKEARGEDIMGDYQLSDLTPEEKRAVVEKIKELEAAKSKRKS